MTRSASAPASHTYAAMDFRVELGRLLQKQRQRLRLSQTKAAELANLSMKYLGEIERGEGNPSLAVLSRLAAALSWNPFSESGEQITEGARVMLLTEAERLVERLQTMVVWLRSIDPNPLNQAQTPQRGRPRSSDRKPAPATDA
jgi:transcriptional regulator with XRE-family HTH domain